MTVAVFITLIVLLILAGVSIATLTGDNGILNQAQRAKDMTNKSKVEEEIQVEVLGSYNNNGELDLDNLNNNLKDNLSGVKYNSVEISDKNKIKILPAVVEYDGYTVVIAENGVTVVEESVKPGEEVKKTEKYNYNDGVNVATIPEGFRVSQTDNEIDTGLVVIAPDDSEFVWVPVPKAVTRNETDGNENKAMAIRLSDGSYRGILYDFTGTGSKIKSGCTTTSSSNREPAYLTNSGTGDESTYNPFGPDVFSEDTLKSEYKEMIESVNEYGGFYVGRYETSITEGNDNVASKKGQNPMSAEESSGNQWYGMYNKQKKYASKVKFGENSEKTLTDIIGSSMIWGSQSDAIMNWILKGSDSNKVLVTSPIHDLTTTGATEEDVMNKIYDLGNNLSEWTLEAIDDYARLVRGGSYGREWFPFSRDRAWPGAKIRAGSRLTLYIK